MSELKTIRINYSDVAVEIYSDVPKDDLPTVLRGLADNIQRTLDIEKDETVLDWSNKSLVFGSPPSSLKAAE